MTEVLVGEMQEEKEKTLKLMNIWSFYPLDIVL